jgi:lactate dehydrogenase-like 2-hydroxyacid dehydrogenase
MAPAAEEELAEAVMRDRVKYVVIGGAPYRGRLYEALGRGGVAARFGVGYDGVNLPKATELGVLCTNTPGVLDQSVAELTMLFIAAAARHLVPSHADMTQHVWAQRGGVELKGRTLAIIGSGRIGRAVARIASAGYGMRVVGFARSGGMTPEASAAGLAAITTDFEAAVAGADFVSVHIPASPENLRFMNADRLARLERGAWLINTARGAVLDEDALYDALVEERLGGAALDVFAREPYAPADAARDLRTLTNVLLLPHVGSHTVEANRGMGERALRNIALAQAGQFADMDLLNPEVARGGADHG